jgi:DDE domain
MVSARVQFCWTQSNRPRVSAGTSRRTRASRSMLHPSATKWGRRTSGPWLSRGVIADRFVAGLYKRDGLRFELWCKGASRPRGHHGHSPGLSLTHQECPPNGVKTNLYRGVDEDGVVVDVLLRDHRDTASAEAFFRQALERAGRAPEEIVTEHHQPYVKAVATTCPDAQHSRKGLHRVHARRPRRSSAVTCRCAIDCATAAD